jgi:hypothetical protein
LVDAEASAVEEDAGLEVFSVPEATCLSFDEHDFAAHSFGVGTPVKCPAKPAVCNRTAGTYGL